MKSSDPKNIYWALARIGLGLIFLWAFFDKLIGLGFATKSENAWLAGGTPAGGFLAHGAHGPLANFYQGLAGNPVVDWLFMLGLLGLGIASVFGIGMRIAGYLGALLMLLMWSALLPPDNHPFLDDHIIYALVLLGLAESQAGDYLGFGKWWSETYLVKRYPVLR